MYNSLIVGFLVKLWTLFSMAYKESLLSKIVGSFNKVIVYLFKGSIIKNIFVSDKSFIEDSIFYNLYCRLVNNINILFKKIYRYFKSIGKDSFVYRNTKSLFINDIEAIRTLLIFVFFFGVGLIGNNLVRGLFSGRSYLISMILIIGSLLGLVLKNNYKEIFNNSLSFNFIKDVFTIDEGGDKWW